MQAHQPTKWESNAHRIGKISVCSLDVGMVVVHRRKFGKIILQNLWQAVFISIIMGVVIHSRKILQNDLAKSVASSVHIDVIMVVVYTERNLAKIILQYLWHAVR